MNLILAIIQGLILDIKYTEEQIKRFVTLSTIIIQNEVTFPLSYVANVEDLTINPEPSDNDFCILVALYASLLIIKNEIKTASSQSIRVTDGPSTIDLTAYSKGLTSYYDILSKDYHQSKLNYIRSGKAGATGLAIITPTGGRGSAGLPHSFCTDISLIDGGNA